MNSEKFKSKMRYKGKSILTNEWLFGSHLSLDYDYIVKNKLDLLDLADYKVYEETVCKDTNLTDKYDFRIFINDIVKLVIDSGEERYFLVEEKSVIRKVVNHPDFIDGTSAVCITGIVFRWHGYDLYPCVDKNGQSDSSKMEIVGNKFDNPKLLNLTRNEL